MKHNVPSSRNESCLFDVKVTVREYISNNGVSVLARSSNSDDGNDPLPRGRAARKRRKKCRRKNRRNKKKCRRNKKQKAQPKTPDSLIVRTCTR